MPTCLLVPIHMDALPLQAEEAVLQPHADFARLPWFDGQRDVNGGVPYISEAILARPFEDRGFRLKAGVHLHWSLPDSLTRSSPLPWVGRRPFLTLFGSQLGMTLWQELLDQHWLESVPAPGEAHVAVLDGTQIHTARRVPVDHRRGPLRPAHVAYHSEIEKLLQHPLFPAVPNRWLITRTVADASPAVEPEQWIVESDYLHPVDADERTGAVTFPTLGAVSEHSPPFRYLGRRTPFKGWQEAQQETPHRYLDDPLTALGYGDPSFAAFYPNCHSVFGAYDDYLGDIRHVRYTIVGWYSNLALDFLHQYVSEFFAVAPAGSGDANLRLLEAITRDLQWRIPINVTRETLPEPVWSHLLERGWLVATEPGGVEATIDPTPSGTHNHLGPDFLAMQNAIERKLGEFIAEQLPRRVICYAELDFGQQEQSAPPAPDVTVAVGNSPPEALAAYLAHDVSPENKDALEEQLELIQIMHHLDNRQLDLNDKFDEARHQRGFEAESGGALWTIRLQSGQGKAADAEKAAARSQLGLPHDLGQLLTDVNRLQQAYDRARFAIEDQRKQLFADWYKYMLSSYPVDGDFDAASDDYPEADEIKYFIEQQTLAKLHGQILETGQLGFSQSAVVVTEPLDPDIQTVAVDLNGSANSLAAQLAALLNQLWRTVRAHNRRPEVRASHGRYLLHQRAAPHYWTPAEPALLLTGDAVQPTNRHGQDGRLRADGLLACFPLEVNSAVSIADQWAHIHAAIRALRDDKMGNDRSGGNERIGHSTQTARPWHPYLLEWEVEFLPAVLPAADLQQAHATDRFILPPTGVEVSITDEHRGVAGGFPYRGRSLLTPNVGTYMGKALIARLVAMLRPQLLASYWAESNVPAAEQDAQLILRDSARFNLWTQNWKSNSHEDEIAAPRAFQPTAVRSAHEQVNDWLEQNLTAVIAWKFSDRAFLSRLARERGDGRTLQPGATQLAALLPQLVDKAGALQSKLHAQMRGEGAAVPRDALVDVQSELAMLRADLEFLVLAESHAALSRQNYLAQVLSGFNQALLMHKQTLQLGIADPIGFADYQPFANAVRQGVLGANISAPQPLQHFLPVRAGAMNLLNLRLVDTFGQALDLNWRQLITTAHMTSSRGEPIHCPPRITQPARLNLRWLAAADDAVEMNDHPAASPICGWLLPNNLDDSLLIFDQQGVGLGRITQHKIQPWQPVPGQDESVSIASIANPHLRRTVETVIRLQLTSLASKDRTEPDADRTAPNFLTQFRRSLENSLENIDPESSAQHEAISLLMGRPIALVRASLSLELRGLPAVDQSWQAFRQDLRRQTRTTAHFETLEFPVRLGEYRRLNDGLVGYWIEEGAGYAHDLFYAPQDDSSLADRRLAEDHRLSHIVGHAEGSGSDTAGARRRCFHRWLAVADEALYLTMLVDPRGKVHATSGILPTKEIHLPPDQYKAALQKIEVTFLTAPILTPAQQINISLPAEPGFGWSWLAKEQDVWRTRGTVGRISKADFLQALADAAPPVDLDGALLWDGLLAHGWLHEQGDDSAIVQPAAERTQHDWLSELAKGEDRNRAQAALLAWIQALFDQSRIDDFEPRATFHDSVHELREGWLKLHAIPAAKKAQ